MTLDALLHQLTTELAAAAIECRDPRQHAMQIVGAVLGLGAAEILRDGERKITPAEQGAVRDFAKRRCSGEPFQYILGREAFYREEFDVGPGVLIPRRETEHLVERVLEIVPRGGAGRVIELGAGSGCIGISVSLERPELEWHAIELSPDAFSFLRKNALRLLPRETKFKSFCGDFFSVVEQGPWDLVVSNPPYVTRERLSQVSREVQHEPTLALDGGVDGMSVIRRLIDVAYGNLIQGGKLVFEIGSDQEDASRSLLKTRGFHAISVLNDYSGLPRIVEGTRAT